MHQLISLGFKSNKDILNNSELDISSPQNSDIQNKNQAI